jgi:predicted glutamine amidotransferase
MCRFVLYLGPPIRMSSLITEPAHSVIHQSFHAHEREEPLNGDGFGVAWYEHDLSDEPGVFRSITPAWSNRNLEHLARMTESPCILAHVRAATPGLPVTETNTHPFAWDRFAFMHNGEIGGFLKVKRQLLARLSDAAFEMIAGTTDSEHLFALFRDRLAARAPGGGASVAAMAAALSDAIGDVLALTATVGEPSYLNVAVSDGHRAVVCRFTDGPPEAAPSLYLHTGRRYVCEGGLCRMIEPEADHHAVIVSSEPLSADPGWSRVPVNHLVLVHRDRAVDVRPVGAG